MFKNTASQKVTVYAVDASTGLPKSGDGANITVYLSKDDGSVTALGDTSATEADATNAKGDYLFDVTQTETNADKLRFTGKSTTSNIVIVPQTIYTIPAALGTAGLFPSVAAGASGGLLISGSNTGTTTLGALTVAGATTLTGNVSMAAGITVTQSTTNGSGVTVTGNGSGHGFNLTGGVTGYGFASTGGATSGGGALFQAIGGGVGMLLLGAGANAGLLCAAGTAAAGWSVIGGTVSGAGVSITTTAGDGISILPTAGNAILATANGTSKHGMVVTGGTAGTSDGIKAVAGTGGVPIRGDITGNLTGNVSGSAGSVTGAVGSVTGAVGSVTGNVGGSVASVTAAVTLSAGDSPVIATGTATAGAGSTITLQTALGADSLVNGCTIKVTGGTGSKQERVITGYVDSTKVVTVDRAWTTNPDNTSVYAVLYGDFPKLDSSLQVTAGSVQGNVTGSVASVTGAVGSVTGAVGSVTGNVGGNVTGSVGSVVAGVTVTTNNDKTGYTLTVTPPTAAAIATAVWTDTTAGDFTTSTSPGKVIFTQLGGAFTTTSSSVFTVASLANAPTGGSAPTTSQIATAVWQDATAGDFTTSGSIGKSLFTSGNAPGAASGLALVGSDVGVATSVSGSVGSVTAGVTVTTNNDKTGYTLTVTPPTAATIATTIWQDLLAGSDFGTATSIGALLKADINATISSRSDGSDTSGTTTLLARLTSTRAGYLDNLSGGAVVLAGSAPGWYTAPVDVSANVTAIKAKTDNLPASPAAVGSPMTLDLTEVVPTSNTANTVGDCLNAARAQGFGVWKIVGTTLSLYAPNGTTVVRSFTLDSITAPTQRV